MPKDIVPAVIKNLSDRVKNPILGSFTVIWIIWHWQFLLILIFSDTPIEQRILKLTSFQSDLAMVASGAQSFFGPLILSILIYIYVPKAYLELEKKWNIVEALRISERKGIIQARLGLDNLEAYEKEIENLKDQLKNALVSDEEMVGNLNNLHEENGLLNQANKKLKLEKNKAVRLTTQHKKSQEKLSQQLDILKEEYVKKEESFKNISDQILKKNKLLETIRANLQNHLTLKEVMGKTEIEKVIFLLDSHMFNYKTNPSSNK